MNFFNSNKSNSNDNEDTPFFNKPSHSIFDEELYRTEQDHAFNFFKTSNVEAKPSILSQLQAEEISGPKIEQNFRKGQERVSQQKININFSQFKEPFSFQPELNSLNADNSKPKNAKVLNNPQEKKPNFQMRLKEKEEKSSKWKSNTISLQMNSEPLNFEVDKKSFPFKRNDKHRPNFAESNKKANLFLETALQPPIKNEEKIKSIQNQKKQPLFLAKKTDYRPNQQSPIPNEMIKRQQKPKLIFPKQMQIEQVNHLQETSSQNSNEGEFTSSLNISSEFLHLKNKVEKKPTPFLAKIRFGRKPSHDQPVEGKSINQVIKPLKSQGIVQKKPIGVSQIDIKSNQKSIQQKKEVKEDKNLEESSNRSAKKISFLNHIKFTPSKTPNFSFAQPKQPENLQRTNEKLTNQASLQNCKQQNKTDNQVFPKGITVIPNQVNKPNDEYKQRSMQDQKVVKKQGLRQQLRKFGSRPTQKSQPNFAQRLKIKQASNKPELKQMSACKTVVSSKQNPSKQQPVLKQTINKQRPLFKQVHPKLSKGRDKQTQQAKPESTHQSYTPKMESLVRTESIFVRSMMLVMQMAVESQKLREVVLSKTQMFNQLSFLEKRCSNRIHSLLDQNKQR